MSERLSVLVVDDEESARETIAALLAREGHDIAFACSGREVFEHLQKDRLPDVVLLDVMMPEMEGFEVCRRVKANPAWRHVPIILVTALEGKEDLAQGLDAGADDFLTKPVNGVELRARVRAMARTKRQHDELLRLMRLREDLAHMVAHDMRSPLGVIIGYAEMLARGAYLGPAAATKVDRIRTQAVVLDRFLNEMLLAAKLEEGRLILNRSRADVHAIIRTTEENHRFEAASRGVRLDVRLPAKATVVSLDADLFARLVDNLLSNAIKFSPADSTVTIVVDEPVEPGSRRSLRIRVEDEGPGVPEEHRERIFEKFAILEARPAGVLQVGLGLAFCKLVAAAHGGRIFVEPNHPQGSVFTVEL